MDLKGIPAFPCENYGLDDIKSECTGMTLRDYFAAKAMQASYMETIDNGQTFTDIAKDAYRMADAMIKEKDKC